MKFPKRVDKHISETKSFKIFSSKIPDHWIIREITERDYGIDCYIELVTSQDDLTGELISIQLKAKEKINWNVKEPTKWTLSGIDISTTNYWYKFSVPAFICVVDLAEEEVYYQSVTQYVKENYYEYKKQELFSYKIDKNNLLSGLNLGEFLVQYFRDKQRKYLEENIVRLFANVQQYGDFYENNIGRDSFMGVNTLRVLFAKHYYDNIHYLSKYFNIKWDIKNFFEYETESVKNYGDVYYLHEEQLEEIVTELDKKVIPLILKAKELIVHKEDQFWVSNNIKLYNFAFNISKNGDLNDW